MRERLKELRLKKGFTQGEMAEEIGILRTSYTNIERGNKNPSIKVALKIKEILGEKEDLFADILEETE